MNRRSRSISSLVIDKPRTTVAWSKLFGGRSCFCLPGFQQLAHRAGRSMSGLRDDDHHAIFDENSLIGHPSSHSFHGGSSSCSHHHVCFGDSVVSDMTESEFSCFVSLSDDDEDKKSASQVHPKLLPQTLSRKGFPPKPPISPHKPPSLQSWNNPTSGSSCCESYQSRNNRSFVTTGSSFSEASSGLSAVEMTKSNHKNFSQFNNNANRSTAGDSSSSVASFHRRTHPMHYDGSYQACVEGVLSEPNSPWRPSQQQQFLVVGRNRLDSEVSALEMESSEDWNEENKDDSTADEVDSVDYSPFPLLQHKGEGRAPRWKGAVNQRERKPFQSLPPPPPPPPPLLRTPPSLLRKHGPFENPKLGRKPKHPNGTTKKHKLRRRWKRRSRPPREMQQHQKRNLDSSYSSEPTDFLCKNTILEERLQQKQTTEAGRKRRVVVSGWIVVLLGKGVVGQTIPCSMSSTTSSNSSSTSRGSLSPGFGTEDLYYLRIVEDSIPSSCDRSASLVLHRSTDGSQEHVFPIEPSWVIESREPEDRRIGRSISISFGRECGGFCWIRMVPVALHHGWRAQLDQKLRETAKEAAHNSNNKVDNRFFSSDLAFVLPPRGRFAPDAQLDTARHLFFTIDSFAKQHR